MSKFTIWTRGQRPLGDLPRGRYQLVFTGWLDKVTGAYLAARALGVEGKAWSQDGHTFTIHKIEAFQTSTFKGEVVLTVDVEGFPWTLLLVALGALGLGVLGFFAWQSLTEVRKIVTTPAGQLATGVSTVIGLAVAGFVVWALNRTGAFK